MLVLARLLLKLNGMYHDNATLEEPEIERTVKFIVTFAASGRNEFCGGCREWWCCRVVFVSEKNSWYLVVASYHLLSSSV